MWTKFVRQWGFFRGNRGARGDCERMPNKRGNLVSVRQVPEWLGWLIPRKQDWLLNLLVIRWTPHGVLQASGWKWDQLCTLVSGHIESDLISVTNSRMGGDMTRKGDEKRDNERNRREQSTSELLLEQIHTDHLWQADDSRAHRVESVQSLMWRNWTTTENNVWMCQWP